VTFPSLFDHPEPNYAVSESVCEFWSVLTTVPVAGLLLLFQSFRLRMRWRIKLLSLWICAMYCCACISHWTLVDPIFRLTVTLVVSQGVFVFTQYSYLVSLVLGNYAEAIGIILEAVVLALVGMLPQRLGAQGGHLSLAVIQTPGVLLGLLAARQVQGRYKESVHDRLVLAGCLLAAAMGLSVVEYALWDAAPSILPVLGGFPLVHISIHILEQVGIYLYGLSLAMLDASECGQINSFDLHRTLGFIPVLVPATGDIVDEAPSVDGRVLLDPHWRQDHPGLNEELTRCFPDAGLVRVLGEPSCFLVKSRDLALKILKDDRTFASHPWPDGRIVALNTMGPEKHMAIKGLLSKYYTPEAIKSIQKQLQPEILQALCPSRPGEPFCAITWIGRVHMASSLHAMGGDAAALAADLDFLDEMVRLNEDMVRLVAPLGGIGTAPPSFLRDGFRPYLAFIMGALRAVPALVSLAARIGLLQTWAIVRPDLTLWQGPCFPRTGTWRHPELLRSVPVYFAILDKLLSSTSKEKRRASEKETCLDTLGRAVDDGLMSRAECLAVMVQLMVNMTTRNAILNLLHRLAEDSKTCESLRKDRSRVGSFICEVLRAETPLQRTPKRALKDTMLDGVFIPRHSTLLLLLGAANMDPRAFAGDSGGCPWAHGDERGHISFGPGARHCLGRHMVLMEMEAVINFVLDQKSAMHVVGSAERLHDVDVGNFGWSKLAFTF